MESKEENGQLRLQLFLSRAGICSRRKAAELIAKRQVSVNAKVCTAPWQMIGAADQVTYKKRPVLLSREKTYILLHKPPQYLSSNADAYGRPLAVDLVKPVIEQRLFSVGRLDFNSSGLLLFTNDGDFARKISHPSFQVEKEYEITTKKEIPPSLLKNWLNGIVIDNICYRLLSYSKLSRHGVHLVLGEGKNREIRRVLHAYNIEIKRVHRIRIATLGISGLGSGEFRKLKLAEIKYFMKLRPQPRPVAKKIGGAQQLIHGSAFERRTREKTRQEPSTPKKNYTFKLSKNKP